MESDNLCNSKQDFGVQGFVSKGISRRSLAQLLYEVTPNSQLLSSTLETVKASTGTNEKLIRQAFYNAAANIFLILAFGISLSVYYILEAFLRPLVWATLSGSFLFPFKRKSTKVVRAYLESVYASPFPLPLHLLVLPFQLLNSAADVVGYFIADKFRYFLACIVAVPTSYFLIVHCTPALRIIRFLGFLVVSLFHAVESLSALWARFVSPYFWLLIGLYLAGLCISRNSLEFSLIKKGGYLAWIAIGLNLFLSLGGSYKLPILCALFAVLALGYWEEKLSPRSTPSPSNLTQLPCTSVEGAVGEVQDEDEVSLVGITQSIRQYVASIFDSNLRPTSTTQALQSSKIKVSSYAIYGLLMAHFILQVIKHIWVLTIFTVPLLLFIVKRIFVLSGLADFLVGLLELHFGFSFADTWASLSETNEGLDRPSPVEGGEWRRVDERDDDDRGGLEPDPSWDSVDTNCSPPNLMSNLSSQNNDSESLKSALLPQGVCDLYRLLVAGDRRIVRGLQSYIGPLMSAIFIILLLVGGSILILFLAFQIQTEAMGLVAIATNVVKEMTSQYPEVQGFLPATTDEIQATLISMLDNGYSYSREWIAHKLDETFGTSGNDTELSRQLLKTFDQIYFSYVKADNRSSNTTTISVQLSQDSQVDPIVQQLMDGNVSISNLKDFVQSAFALEKLYSIYDIALGNMDMLRSIAEPIWIFFKGNVNLLFNLVTAVLSLLLSSGSQIINFLLSVSIFLTTLFYLLSCSDSQYKPMEFLGSVFPNVTSPTQTARSSDGDISHSFGGVQAGGVTSQASTGPFGKMVNDAVQGVFGASLRLALCHGLYTWLTHSLFGIDIVCVPALVAALLAAIPIFGSYLAALPAVLQLWLVREQPGAALLLVLLHLLPLYAGLDALIYSEIGGGSHPYITGLSVVGGIYVGGIEGALVGPILLCLLIVLANIYRSMINQGDDEELDTKVTTQK